MATGFIGLGNMGWSMAANLAKAGRFLVVWDTDVNRTVAFAKQYGVAVATGPDSFSEVLALVTMLPNGEVVREVLIDGGVAAALHRDAMVIDCSSSDPVGTRELGMELAEHSLTLVDAPVSGGRAKAVDGTLSIMLGAANDVAVARAMPTLRPMCSRIFRTGGLGTAHAMKALNNFVLGAGFIAAAEALVVGRKFGLDPTVMVEILNASSGRNVSTETTLVTEVLTRRFAANFSLGLFAKDLGSAADLAARLGIDAPLAALVHERMAAAGAELGMQTDYTAVVELWEQLAGVEDPTLPAAASQRTQGTSA